MIRRLPPPEQPAPWTDAGKATRPVEYRPQYRVTGFYPEIGAMVRCPTPGGLLFGILWAIPLTNLGNLVTLGYPTIKNLSADDPALPECGAALFGSCRCWGE
jgi:hypothetical protein